MPAIKRIREEIDAFIKQAQLEELSLIDRAISTAAYAHSGAVRKGTAVPYILHPLEAAAIVTQVIAEQRGTAPNDMTPSDNFIIAAAILHYTVEDTDLTAEDIKTLFGPETAALVAAETENKRKSRPVAETWKIRKTESIKHLAIVSEDAKLVAFWDKLSNLRAIAADYRRLGYALWERFNQKDPAEHAWYYGEMGKVFKVSFDSTLCFQEYSDLYKLIFEYNTLHCEII